MAGYRESLDEFFARLAEEDEPSAIAGLAGTLPDAPDLDAVRADARSRAMKALEEQESAQAVASTDDGSTSEGPTDEGATDDGGPTNEAPTNEAPTDEGATDEGATDESPIDAPGALPPSVEELVPVMEPEPVTDPLPVMDPGRRGGVARERGLPDAPLPDDRTSPTEGPENKGSSARP